jgi:hypothetical protein
MPFTDLTRKSKAHPPLSLRSGKTAPSPSPRPRRVFHDLSPQTKTPASLKKKLLRFDKSGFLKKEILRFLLIGLIFLAALEIAHLLSFGQIWKNRLSQNTEQAQEEFKAGLGNLAAGNFDASKIFFQRARDAFASAQKIFQNAGDLDQNLLNQSGALGGAKALLKSGANLAEAGALFSQSAQNLSRFPTMLWGTLGQTGATVKPTELLRQEEKNLQRIYALLDESNRLLQALDLSALPADLQNKTAAAKNALATVLSRVVEIQDNLPVLFKLLGEKHPTRFLVLLQNSSELRPTGGFLGSFLKFSLRDGLVENWQFEDVYERAKNFAEPKPPPGFENITNAWALQDANYFPDFPTSAKKVAWFYERNGGESFDVILGVDDSLLKNFLALTGPIISPQLPEPLTAENANLLLSTLVEAKLTGERTPKKIIAEVIPLLRAKIFQEKTFFGAAQIFLQAVTERHLQAFAFDPKIEAVFARYDLDGQIAATDLNEDYLNVVNASVSGNKSDAFITQKIWHATQIASDGTLTDTVTIARRHNWDFPASTAFRALAQKLGITDAQKLTALEAILGNGKNISYLKIYAPWGSELVNALGIENSKIQTGTESGKTFFATTVATLPANETKITLVYKLPFKLYLHPVADYRLKIQKQAGVDSLDLEKTFTADEGLKIYRTNLGSAEKITAVLKSNLEVKAVVGKR